MMAALGVWLWSHPQRFSASTFCETASTVILNHPVPLRSLGLRVSSLVIYSVFLVPALNLIVPAGLFLAIFILHRAWREFGRYIGDKIPLNPSIFPTVIGMTILCSINVVFLLDIELTLFRNRAVHSAGEATWTFGQILALLLLVLPLRDIWITTIARRHTLSLQDALRKNAPTEEVLHAATQPGADVNTRVYDCQYSTLLELAVLRKDMALIALLLRLGADPNLLLARGGRYGTVLETATFEGTMQAVILLLSHGANPNAGSPNYGSLLWAVVFLGRPDFAKLFLQNGADPNLPVDGHVTALYAAASEGNAPMTRLLLAHGANPDTMGGESHGTPLQAAASNGHLDVVNILLEHGADLNARHHNATILAREYGRTALQAAAANGHLDIFEILVAHGADPDIRDIGYKTALQILVGCEDLPAVTFLLERGADPNIPGGRYGTALHDAAYAGSLELVKVLLEHGADLNTEGSHHENVLQAVAYCGNMELVRLLLQHGADPAIYGGEFGNTLKATLEEEFPDIVQCLREFVKGPGRSERNI
ncbi:ankyrin repeat-containing domain protein [Mycena polygramma]|nr:ankyrin repeat-containing domain protein [Mycena polygramma]